MAPDGALLAEIEKRHRPFPFSGLPATGRPTGEDQPRTDLSRELRLAAARGGCTHLLCVWGTIEAVRENQVTKSVSWVPIAGYLIPDETQRMRLRVRAVLMDVATGRWSVLTPPPAENAALSPGLLRGYSHDKQVYELKTRAYAALAEAMAG